MLKKLTQFKSNRNARDKLIHSTSVFVFLSSASAPTPFYAIYQQNMQFSDLILSLGCTRIVFPLAKPKERASTIALFYIISYSSNSIPVIFTGYLATQINLSFASICFAILVFVWLIILSLHKKIMLYRLKISNILSAAIFNFLKKL
ncbi:hypothetical protein [Shewanella zhangzhouensis]|uniref:hypothetical protein n=1 Tax=Shewanella zhangzhouensis TaxID=2864213 RepID=UPI001C66138B|nr:hypothetical protein [Shewanella zhangzhouensis]QYK07008.1 hypothetical protein K0H63_09545 [Shewanella zhangzhouensis]